MYPQNQGSKEEINQILSAYHERMSMRGIARRFHILRNTLKKVLKKGREQATVKNSLLPAESEDVLELDEIWSFVFMKTAKSWLWTAIGRRTRQIVAFVIGDRSAETCQRLWQKIPKQYRECHTLSDFWEAYEKILSKETHRSVGKQAGQTCHMERWNCTVRQKLARFVRKTLSFSKAEYMPQLVTCWFIVEYNLASAHNHAL